MSLIDLGYKSIVRPFLFQFDPEKVHEWAMKQMKWARLGKPILRKLFCCENPKLQQTIWGLPFPNPLGLAGGFDKNAVNADIWELFGFGFFEIGTLTPKPQPGNPKPRLFRYPGKKAIVNRMGFNNEGSQTIAERLQRSGKRRRNAKAIMGVSLGKQRDTPADNLQAVIEDYRISLQRLYRYGDFFIINISSPNTPNLRSLQQRQPLTQLMYALKDEMLGLEGGEHPKPLCVKLAPDLSDDDVREAVDAVKECGVDGIIASNTSNQTKDMEEGGLSGQPLRRRSTEMIRLIAEQTEGKLPIIGCGGIFTADDAVEKLEAGAWLLQIYTSFVYEGPRTARSILEGLVKYLDQKGVSHIAELRTRNAAPSS
ncbi:MAG: quinone-dependent dihydroorotate dehydrogenase [Candidatus Omnitrophica bacterium]|nr:quinone-dependent dihydroorotate dehydrogenase [Candidatus Omnitrophota bacterium]